MSGMDTAREIRKLDEEAAIIFVTTSSDHAVDSYGVRASGYLIKPFTYEAFGETMRLARLGKIMNARFIALGDDRILLKLSLIHILLVCGIYLADFAMFAGGKCCFIVLSAVDNAGLERGIYIAVGHGYRDSA